MRRTRFSGSSQKLINKFITEGRLEAFDLAAAFLEITADPKASEPQESEMYRSIKPQARLDEWQYSQFLKEEFPKLIELDANRALDLVSKLLLDYVRLSYPDHDIPDKENSYNDISQVWRPAIENHSQNHQFDQVENSLVTAVRDTALKIIESNPTALKEIVAKLESYKWIIFRRISMYLISQFPTLESTLVAERLLNRDILEESDFRHEYAGLAQSGFEVLSPDQQEKVLGMIEDASRFQKAIEADRARRELTDEQALRILEVWKRDRLSHFKDHLTGTWKQRYDDLVTKFGAPDHPDFSSYSSSYVGPTSVTNAKSLIDMGSEKMFELLKTWKPTGNRFDFGPTKEGLGRDISAAVKLDPEYFEPLAEKFKELDPTYVRSYLDGFYNLAQNNAAVSWVALLELSTWVMAQPREMPGRQGGVMDQDPDWGWTRRTIGSLVSRGLSTSAPFEMRDIIWKIIELLTEDPNPTPAEERTKDGAFVDDAYTLAINTVRGEAMNAAMEYGLWVYRNIEETEGGKERLKKEGFQVMPELQRVLEKHLDPAADSSIAVRAIYGRFFPWILMMDRAWTIAHLDAIWPPGRFEDPLYLAAWQAYMVYADAYNEPLLVLKSRYLEAIRNIGSGRKMRHVSEDERLTQHLMVFYWRGKLALDDELIVEFWNTADAKSRQFALDFIGRSLLSDNSVLPVEAQTQLKALWDQRLTVAETAADKVEYAGEMSAFGWWFASGDFDDLWSCEQYLRALEIGEPRTNADHYIAKRLVELVKTFPVAVIKILGKLTLGDRHTWLVFGNKDAVNSIISTALESPEEEAKTEAKELISRLMANGHVEFRNLLTGGSPSPQ